MDKRKNSGVGVLDKSIQVLSVLESGPHSLAELVAATGIVRPPLIGSQSHWNIIASSLAISPEDSSWAHGAPSSQQRPVKIDFSPPRIPR